MKIDTEKIQRYLLEIKARHHEIKELLSQSSDAELLKDPWVLKGLKYTLVEIAEALANILQHILAKEMGEPVTGYVETVIQAGETNILPNHLSEKINYPAASCGALKSKTYFHVVIPSCGSRNPVFPSFFWTPAFAGVTVI